MKLGHPPAPLARLPALPSLTVDFQPLQPFPSVFLSHIRPFLHSRHRALRSPRGRAGHPRAARLNPRPHVWRVSPRGKEGSPVSHRTHSDPFWGARPESQPPAASPGPPPHSPRAPRRYSALREPPAAPARSRRRRASSEPEAKGGWEGRWGEAWVGPGEGAGPGGIGKPRGWASATSVWKAQRSGHRAGAFHS